MRAEKNGPLILRIMLKTICEKMTRALYIETGIECNKRDLMLITEVSGCAFPLISCTRNVLIFPCAILNELQIGFSQLSSVIDHILCRRMSWEGY